MTTYDRHGRVIPELSYLLSGLHEMARLEREGFVIDRSQVSLSKLGRAVAEARPPADPDSPELAAAIERLREHNRLERERLTRVKYRPGISTHYGFDRGQGPARGQSVVTGPESPAQPAGQVTGDHTASATAPEAERPESPDISRFDFERERPRPRTATETAQQFRNRVRNEKLDPITEYLKTQDRDTDEDDWKGF